MKTRPKISKILQSFVKFSLRSLFFTCQTKIRLFYPQPKSWPHSENGSNRFQKNFYNFSDFSAQIRYWIYIKRWLNMLIPRVWQNYDMFFNRLVSDSQPTHLTQYRRNSFLMDWREMVYSINCWIPFRYVFETHLWIYERSVAYPNCLF